MFISGLIISGTWNNYSNDSTEHLILKETDVFSENTLDNDHGHFPSLRKKVCEYIVLYIIHMDY